MSPKVLGGDLELAELLYSRGHALAGEIVVEGDGGGEHLPEYHGERERVGLCGDLIDRNPR